MASAICYHLCGVHLENDDAHKHHLREVFQHLQKAGLTLKGNKCHFGLPEVSYLGHVFSGSRIAPDPAKTQAVKD